MYFRFLFEYSYPDSPEPRFFRRCRFFRYGNFLSLQSYIFLNYSEGALLRHAVYFYNPITRMVTLWYYTGSGGSFHLFSWAGSTGPIKNGRAFSPGQFMVHDVTSCSKPAPEVITRLKNGRKIFPAGSKFPPDPV